MSPEETYDFDPGAAPPVPLALAPDVTRAATAGDAAVRATLERMAAIAQRAEKPRGAPKRTLLQVVAEREAAKARGEPWVP